MHQILALFESAVPFLLFADVKVLPPHLHAPTGVNLQADHTLGEFWSWIRIVHNLYAIQMSNDVSAQH
jgi:hypothetical protein